MKTEPRPRLRASSIDFFPNRATGQRPRSSGLFFTTSVLRPERLPSYFSATSAETHRVIRENIQHSPLIPALLKGVSAATVLGWKIK